MNNTNELTILIRAQDEFSDIFTGFGKLCREMQATIGATVETLDNFTTVLNHNLGSLRESYSEFGRLAALFGGASAKTALPEITGGDQGLLALDGHTNAQAEGLYPFDALNTAVTLQNLESVKTALWEFQEFKVADQDFNAQLAASQLQCSAETTQQLIKDLQTVENSQAQSQAARYQMLTGFLGSMGQATKLFGKEAFGVSKALGVAEATVGAYLSFNRTMGAYPYPVNVALAGVSLATSLVQVSRIAATSAGIAHGGLDYVPREQTYLLDRGERVLSPQQNRDLTAFLANGQNPVTIENIHVEILPNVTDAGALYDLDERQLQDFVEDRLLAALRELRLAGLDY